MTEKTFGYRTKKQARAIAQSLRRNSSGLEVHRSGRQVTVSGNIARILLEVRRAELRVKYLHEYTK